MVRIRETVGRRVPAHSLGINTIAATVAELSEVGYGVEGAERRTQIKNF